MAGSVARQGIDRVLSHSPKAHQSLPGPAPELCSGDHQKGCDLEGVEEAAPLRHTQLTHFKTMTTFNTQDQIIELTDDQLEAAQGGNFGRDLVRGMYEHVRNGSPTLRIFEWLNGGRGPLA